MPKYFEGEINISSEIIKFETTELTLDKFKTIELQKGKFVISIRFQNLDANSLGYVFFVERNQDSYTLRDIKEVTMFTGINIIELFDIILHASGIKYLDRIQCEFNKKRNEIGIE